VHLADPRELRADRRRLGDVQLAGQIAQSTGVSPATMPALVSVFERALADPQLKDADWSAIAEVSRRDLR